MSKVTGVGLGLFPFANVFSKVAEPEKIIFSFIENGGMYIDTAPVYEVDDILSKILTKIPRGKYLLSSKCVTGANEVGEKVRSGKYDRIISQCNIQLRELGIDCFDIYMSHIPAPDATFDETMSAMVDLQKQGKIKEIGVSNVKLDQLKEYNKNGDVSYVQNRFSLLNQSFSNEFNKYCQEFGIKYIPYQVIERGQLTNKALDGLQYDDNDLRNKKPEFDDGVWNEVQKWVVGELYPIAQSQNLSLEVLSIGWSLHQPNMALCVVGATTSKQIEETLKAQSVDLDEDVLNIIDAKYDEFEKKIKAQYGKTLSEFRGT